MTTSVHIIGRLDYSSTKGRDQGLEAFDSKAFIEFVTKDDWELIDKKSLTIDRQTEAPADCIEHFNEAFVAAAAKAKAGSVELRWGSEVDGVERVYAGGHLVRLLPRKEEGPLRSLRLENVARDYLYCAGTGAQCRKSDHEFLTWAASGSRLAAVVGISRYDLLPSSDVAFCRALYYSPANNGVALFDLETGAELWRAFVANWRIMDMAWSPRGDRLALAAGDTITILDGESGTTKGKFKAFKKGTTAIAWSKDGSMIAALGRDSLNKKHKNRLGLWKLEGKGGERLKDLDAPYSHSVVFSDDDSTVTTWSRPGRQDDGESKTYVVKKGGDKKQVTPRPKATWVADKQRQVLTPAQ